MGEKPLSIDEAPVRTAAGGVAPAAGLDAPPPAMTAGSISTTRSNIKNSGAARAGPGGVTDQAPPPDLSGAAQSMSLGMETLGAVADRPPPIDGNAAVGTDGAGAVAEGDPIPGADVKLGSNKPGAATTVGPVKPEPTRPADPTPADAGPSGYAIKEQGIK